MNKSHIDYLRWMWDGVVIADNDWKLSKWTAQAITGLLLPKRIVTAAGNVTVTSADYTIWIFKTVPQATVVDLPAWYPEARFEISDFADNAATYNITITPNWIETIMWQPTMVINVNWWGVTLVFNELNQDRRII